MNTHKDSRFNYIIMVRPGEKDEESIARRLMYEPNRVFKIVTHYMRWLSRDVPKEYSGKYVKSVFVRPIRILNKTQNQIEQNN